jgi:hypothetical protein
VAGPMRIILPVGLPQAWHSREVLGFPK